MKAISLWQPWASLMAAGRKRVETRSWPTAHRGPLLIHASGRWDRGLAAIARQDEWVRDALAPLNLRWSTHDRRMPRQHPDPRLWRPSLPFGAVIAVVDVTECIRTQDAVRRWSVYEDGAAERYAEEIHLGDYTPGRWAWLTTNARRFRQPIPCRGHQGLFEVPDALAAEAVAGAEPAPGK